MKSSSRRAIHKQLIQFLLVAASSTPLLMAANNAGAQTATPTVTDSNLTVRTVASPEGQTTSAAQATAGPATPANFRLARRSGSELWLAWEQAVWAPAGIHYEFSYSGRTVVLLRQYDIVNALDVSPGPTTFSVRAIDEAGRASASAQLLFETTPPDPPTNLQQLSTVRLASGEYPDQISFTPGRDNAGVVRRYVILLDGRVLDHIGLSGATTQFSLYRRVFDSYTSIPCGPTALQLRSEDSSFNLGPPSMTLTVFFPEYEHCPPPHAD
jgi:hypothetical protein